MLINSSICFSLKTLIPSFSSNAVVIPFPITFFPVKLPSYILFDPQEGELSFNIAYLTLFCLAINKDILAPVLKLEVTSFPFLFMTRPFFISLGQRGVESPPNTSGQIITKSHKG